MHANLVVRSIISLLLFQIISPVLSQKLELEWNGSEEDLIQLIEGGKIRFSIEGHTADVSDRITFRIKSEPADTLTDVMTIVEEGNLRLEKEPIHAQDAVTKNYVDQILLDFGISLGAAGIQGLLYAGYCPLELLAKGVAKDSLYGKFYQGGLIFYIDDMDTIPGLKGLISAPADRTPEVPSPSQWGCVETEIAGADEIAIGSGNQNTLDIKAGCSTNSIAADLCLKLVLNGFDDWYLPSKDELNEMYLKIGFGASGINQNIGEFTYDAYWSSSEFGSSTAWDQTRTGIQANRPKSNIRGFRPIRSF